MSNSGFLNQLAADLLKQNADLTNTIVVLPSKRAKVFLLRELQLLANTTLFAPAIWSVEDLVSEMASLRKADNIESLFELYKVYLRITPADKIQSFENFANWGKIILQDFNEIDRYLLNPKQILSYLTDIERLKRWSPAEAAPTGLVEKYLDFWTQLPEYYDHLYEQMKQKGMAYQGMMYREAIANLNHFTDGNASRSFVFAGLNALNAAEEQIVKHLLAEKMASIYWDADKTILGDEMHDAGLFLRRFKDNWAYYHNNDFNWISDSFGEEKHIEIIGTPKSVGQAIIAGKKIEELIRESGAEHLNKTALILGDENLLLPMLHALPSDVGALNITMGYPARQNPTQILISKLFRMHLNARKRAAEGYVIYYKDLLEVLTHPLVQPYADVEEVIRVIKQYNYSFITHQKVMELGGENTPLFHAVMKKWSDVPGEVLLHLSDLLLLFRENLGTSEQTRITRTFVYALYQVINKLSTFFSTYSGVANLETLYSMYKQVIDLAEVSFEGEPLQGLQLMGVLESRALDFETVIITSMNEGRFPAGKASNSFIPYDVKREKGLPTFKEKDAIFTYHFYRLLQRAKRIVLLYNTDGDGIDGGEKSRFLTQLEIEKQPLHHISHKIYRAQVPKVAHVPVRIPKSERVVKRLAEIAESGFYPTNITTYIRNPLLFYYRKVLRIREADDVEENIALNTLGTIIHESLKNLYAPFLKLHLTTEMIRQMMSKVDEEVMTQFREVYKMGEIKKGKNLLAFEVAKRNVHNFLKMELRDVEQGDKIEIVALEQTFERQFVHPRLSTSILLKGNVDRIERRNGVLRIMDYKTGKVSRFYRMLLFAGSPSPMTIWKWESCLSKTFAPDSCRYLPPWIKSKRRKLPTKF